MVYGYGVYYAPINVKPQGEGRGGATHGKLTESAFPWVGILTFKRCPRVVTREWMLQNKVSARRLELNETIFRQIAPTRHDLVVFKEISIQRLKKAKMRMVTPKYGSKPT